MAAAITHMRYISVVKSFVDRLAESPQIHMLKHVRVRACSHDGLGLGKKKEYPGQPAEQQEHRLS